MENDDTRLLWDGVKELEKAREYDMRIAKEKAKKEGFEQGINSNKIEIAKNLLKNNIDIEIISTSTGLSKDEIINLK